MGDATLLGLAVFIGSLPMEGRDITESRERVVRVSRPALTAATSRERQQGHATIWPGRSQPETYDADIFDVCIVGRAQSIAYNARQRPAASVVECVGELRGQPLVEVVVTEVELVRLARDGRVYRWTTSHRSTLNGSS